MLSALLIEDQNSKENSKTYLTMLSLTIVGLQEIIPKLMALQRGWFRHVRKCHNPTLAKCGAEAQHLEKLGILESSGTLECVELDSKAQNTSHLCVLDVIGKVLKRRYRKWPRIGHLDICSPSYGTKKGRESNWQFDSRPLKVGNRPFPDIRFECAT